MPTTVPARSALTMNGKSKSWLTSRAMSQVSCGSADAATSVLVPVVVVRRCLGLTDDDESAVGRGEHLDARAVEPAQRRTGDHLRGGADGRAPLPEVDHAVHVAEDRVDVVRDQQHGHALVLAD